MGKKNNKQQKSSTESSDYLSIFFYCILIIVLPIVTFFTSKLFIFDNYFNLTQIQSNIYAAISAIIALHLALGLYLYRAYFEHDPQSGYGSLSGVPKSTKHSVKQD